MPLFRTETVTSISTLVTQLNTFLVLAGGSNPNWTSDLINTGTGLWAISKDDGGTGEVEVAFAWDTGTPNNLAIFQYHTGLGAGNYNLGNNPWAQAGDSGNGAASQVNATIATSRHVAIGATPIRYWAFASDPDANVYVVVQTSALEYVHFGFGALEKNNDYDGGEFAYGNRFQVAASADFALEPRSTCLLDGRAGTSSGTDMEDHAATVHLEGIPASPVNGMWAVHMQHQVGGTVGNNWLLGQDRQTVPVDRIQCIGGFRAGAVAVWFGQFPGSLSSGRFEAYPIVCVNSDRNDTDTMYPLGQMVDVRGVSLRNLQAQDTRIIGSDTWHVFPTHERGEGSGAPLSGTSALQGIMYKEN